MRKFEIDWQHTCTWQTLDAIDRGLLQLEGQLPECFDLEEHVEDMVGLGFVALQTYVRSTCAAVRAGFPDCPHPTRLRAGESPLVDGTGLTYVEAVWTAGNYYKHHDEWPDWQPTGSRRETVLALSRLGISPASWHPCTTVLVRLQDPDARLRECLAVLRRWREAWLERLSRA